MPSRTTTSPAGPRIAFAGPNPPPRQNPASQADPATDSFKFEEERESALLAAWRGGDRAALEELLLTVEPRLMSLCFRMCGRPQDARDLCQEALVKIIQGLPSFSGRSRLSTWMIRIAMNVCLTDRRRSRLRIMPSLDAPARGSAAADGATLADSRVQSKEPAASLGVERNEDLSRLAQALVRIEPEQRALLILRDAQGLDYADIADVLEIPVGTVKSRLFRARAALRDHIEHRRA